MIDSKLSAIVLPKEKSPYLMLFAPRSSGENVEMLPCQSMLTMPKGRLWSLWSFASLSSSSLRANA